MLLIEHLAAAYGARVILDDVSLQAHPGEIVGLIGPNGAGKSSLLRVVSGTLAPTRGSLHLNGVDLTRLSPAMRARRIAVVPQSSHLPEAFTVGEVVLMGRTPHLPLLGGERQHDYDIVREALARTATEALAERRIGELSGGEQQRVLMARALAQISDGATADAGPRVLLLDEATAHLDLRHQTAIWSLVRELARSGLIVLAALHDLNLAGQYADRLALLSEGRLIACDLPARVLTPEWLRRAYQVSAIVSSHPLYATPLVALIEEEKEKRE
ncbi:MAG: heme ABC transporter ATP-binding protein [Anaerolineae bacterium]